MNIVNQLTNLGLHHRLIRVNGRRSVLGVGHTEAQALDCAFEQAAESFSHVAVVFELLAQKHSANRMMEK